MIKWLKIKFICINMTIVTAMLLVIFGMVFHFTQQNLRRQSLQMMQNIQEERFRPRRPEKRPQEITVPYFSVLMNEEGESVSITGEYYDLSDEVAIRELARSVYAGEEQTGVLKEYALRYQKRMTPKGLRIVFADISVETAMLNSLLKNCILIGFLSFSAFLGLSFVLARWAVKPVETAWNQQRQFVADASHELKTPLTVIMTNAELLQAPEYSQSERSRFADSILTMSRQMRGLVESLLELARVDNGTAKMEHTSLDFSELLADSLLPFEPVLFEKELQLDSHIEEGVRIRGSASHLKQVVDILLDNAAKYSLPEGTVSVRLGRQGSSCMLSVSNPAEPIGREDLKNIFKRFYRIDKARTMNQSYGLGLSIAQSIVSEHKGKIWAESSGGNITVFVQLAMEG